MGGIFSVCVSVCLSLAARYLIGRVNCHGRRENFGF